MDGVNNAAVPSHLKCRIPLLTGHFRSQTALSAEIDTLTYRSPYCVFSVLKKVSCTFHTPPIQSAYFHHLGQQQPGCDSLSWTINCRKSWATTFGPNGPAVDIDQFQRQASRQYCSHLVSISAGNSVFIADELAPVAIAHAIFLGMFDRSHFDHALSNVRSNMAVIATQGRSKFPVDVLFVLLRPLNVWD